MDDIEWDVVDASTGYAATRTANGMVRIQMGGSPIFSIKTASTLSAQDSYLAAAERLEKFAALRERENSDEGGPLRALALLTLRRAEKSPGSAMPLGTRVQVRWNHGFEDEWYTGALLAGGRVQLDESFPFVEDGPFVLEPEEIIDLRLAAE